MKEKVLTAKEWLEREGKNDVVCNVSPEYKGFGFHASDAMEEYATYRNKVLQGEIMLFRQFMKSEEDRYALNRSFAHAEISEAVFDLLKEYDKHFGITCTREGKIK